MTKDKIFKRELKDINLFYKRQQIETENRIRKLLITAICDVGDYFLSKDFIYVEEHITYIPPSGSVSGYKNYVEIVRYYYDKNTKVGIRVVEPYNIYLDRENTFIPLRVVYKIGDIFKEYDSEIYYRYTKEESENIFKRFKSYNGKAGVIKVKNYMREHFKKEMLIVDRNEKIKNLNSL